MKKLIFIFLLFSTYCYGQKVLFKKVSGASCSSVSAINGTLSDPGFTGYPQWSSDARSPVSAITTKSILFDGVSGYISLSSDVVLGETGSLVIDFKATGFAGVIAGNSGDADTYIYVGDATHIYTQTDAGGNSFAFVVPTMSTGTWYTLVITRVAGVTHLYLDGVESTGTGNPPSQSGNLTINEIGRYFDNSSNLGWNGKLTVLLQYDVVLSGSEITGIQSGTYPDAPPTCSKHFYKFNEGSGNTLNDTVH